MTRAFIGVGANIDPEANVRRALRLLARETAVVAISTFYRTPAEGRPEQPDYVNGVVEVETALGPRELVGRVLHGIEDALGRRRSEDRFAARPIDLDLLVHDGVALRVEEIEQRAFVAVPLAELAPELSLPDGQGPMSAVAARFAGSPMTRLEEFSESIRREVMGS